MSAARGIEIVSVARINAGAKSWGICGAEGGVMTAAFAPSRRGAVPVPGSPAGAPSGASSTGFSAAGDGLLFGIVGSVGIADAGPLLEYASSREIGVRI